MKSRVVENSKSYIEKVEQVYLAYIKFYFDKQQSSEAHI